MTTNMKSKSLKGAEWLIHESNPVDIFIPEDFTEEQQMIMDMCQQYLDTEVLPVVDRMDKMDMD